MIAVIIFIFAMVFIAYHWFTLNPDGYTGRRRNVRRK